MATSKSSSIESVVFQKLCAKLHDGIQMDLNPIAMKLYSAGVISLEIRNKATQVSLDLENRASTLLKAIEERIRISRNVFWEFLEILEFYRENLATEFREEFEKFKNKPEQCDGVSEDPDLPVPTEPARERKEASSSYVLSITASNGTALTGQCIPQPDTSLNRDLMEQGPLLETGTMSPTLFVGSNSLKSWPALLGESDGNEESSRIKIFTDSAAAAVDASEVQGEYYRKYTKLKQEYAKTSKYYKQQLERRDQKCKEFEKELELTRKELEQCKSDHEKEVSFMVRVGSAEDQKLQQKLQEQGRLLRQKDSELQEQGRILQEKDSEAQEQGQTLREKDSELQEMKQKLDTKLMERDNHIHRVEAELNGMKAQLQQKEMELQEKKQEDNLLQGRLEQEVIKRKLYMCEKICELVDEMRKERNDQELQEIRERIDKKISELRVSVVRRKSLSWSGVMYSQDHYFRS